MSTKLRKCDLCLELKLILETYRIAGEYRGEFYICCKECF